MTPIIPLTPNTSKVIPMFEQQEVFNLEHFRKTYGDAAGTVLQQFVEDVYNHYTQSSHWKALPFPRQVEAEYTFQVRRTLIQHPRRIQP